jgi:hypothetical protein
MKVTGEGTEPTPVKFSGQRSRDRGAKRLPGIAERQLGILNRSVFPDAELALGDPRVPARPIELGNSRRNKRDWLIGWVNGWACVMDWGFAILALERGCFV